jgi:Hemolysin activation/secretion protein
MPQKPPNGEEEGGVDHKGGVMSGPEFSLTEGGRFYCRFFYCRFLAVMTLVGAFATAEVFAQDFERYRPQPLPVETPPSLPQETPLPPVTGSDQILLQKLEAIVVLDRADKVVADGVHPDAEGLLFDVANPRSLVYSQAFRTTVEPYLNQPVSLRTLSQLSHDIIRFYRYNKRPVIDVLIPEQRITEGTLQIVVLEGTVGKVQVQDGRFFSWDDTARWIESTRVGGEIYEPWLEDDLFWLNQNPFRRVGVDLKPGSENGLTDVLFTVDDVFPIRAYVGYDDTGVRVLGLERLSAGFMVGNLTGRGDTASYQYTTDSDLYRLHAHAATYTLPINRDYTFQTYGSWAGVSPTVGGGFNQDGESWMSGFALVRTLEKNRYVDQNVSIGFDFKATNNNLEFGGTNVFASEADLTSINLGYQDLFRDNCDQYRIFDVDLIIGPGSGFTKNNNATAFSTIRPDTDPVFVYARARYERAHNLTEDWQLTFRGVGQVTSDRLLFSEMLGFGGYDSIRGYDQRTANGDHGWITSFEFGPRPVPLEICGQEGRLRVYVFGDLGQAFTMNPQPGEFSDLFMSSAGFGMRFSLAQDLMFRFDYGYNFNPVPGYDSRQRVHLGLVWQFGPLPN